MCEKVSSSFFVLALLYVFSTTNAQQPNPEGTVKAGEKVEIEAYLFAHMTHQDYGRLYYTVSLDGLHWELLNAGKRVFGNYKGHPDITKGHDGRYYLVGNNHDGDLQINIWVSDDLIIWEEYSHYTPDLNKTPEYKPLQRLGAPKVYFDQSTRQYILLWHTPHLNGTEKDAERYWQSQRTLYVLSKDLKTFPDTPKKLFEWDMGTIDVFIRKIDETYYAILKDERYPTLEWTTGKTIRVCSSENLTGPYSYPQESISPNFREAPMLVPSQDGKHWYMYYEQYPGVSYGLSVSRNINGPWYQVSGYTHHSDWDKYSMPDSVRHGCMIPISRNEYDKLIKHFEK